MLLFVFLFAAACACAVNADVTNKKLTSDQCLCVDGTRVNARSRPGGKVKAQVNTGECYKFARRQRRKGSYEWFRISVGGRRLWVAGPFLNVGSSAQCGASSSGGERCGDVRVQRWACRLIKFHNRKKIALWKQHPSRVQDNAYAYNNIYDTCKGKGASRSSCRGGCNAPGGRVCLNRQVVKYLIKLAKTGYIHVNEVAGACHSCTSRHFRGLAVDLHKDRRASEYLKLCKQMKGYGLDEGRHIHCQFF